LDIKEKWEENNLRNRRVLFHILKNKYFFNLFRQNTNADRGYYEHDENIALASEVLNVLDGGRGRKSIVISPGSVEVYMINKYFLNIYRVKNKFQKQEGGGVIPRMLSENFIELSTSADKLDNDRRKLPIITLKNVIFFI